MAGDRFESLTESERVCLRLAMTREGSKLIAPAVGLTHHTVDKRFKSAMRKLGASSRFEAARLFAHYEQARDPALDQSSDGADQAPDVVRIPPAFMVAGTIKRPATAAPGPGRGLREEQAPFLVDRSLRPGPMRFPVRRANGGGNDLGAWQRIGWIVGLTMMFALTFGVLTSGLTSLGKVVTHVAHTLQQHTS